MAILELEGDLVVAPVEPVRVERLLACEDVGMLVGVFEEIAASEGWRHGGELRAHSERSAYFGLWAVRKGFRAGGANAAKELVGGLQLVRPDDAGMLPCQKLWPEIDIGSGAGAAYVAVLAVRREWRGKKDGKGNTAAACFWTLTGALWRHCMDSGITHLWLEVTPTMMRCYRLLGWPLEVRGPLRSHWGEDCYPCSLSLRETAGALVEKALRSRTYRQIVETALNKSPATVQKANPQDMSPGAIP
ncbi:MAG: hypothetical protein V4671_15550 [Armatimonadota bacterium]